jgi:addiction module RelB/DinJ family antitoxin
MYYMTTMISTRIQSDIKQKASAVFDASGITMSMALNNYLLLVADSGQVPFYTPEPITPYLSNLLDSIESEIEQGGISNKFSTMKDMLIDLKK